MQSSMEMHLKMVTAEEHLNGQQQNDLTSELSERSPSHRRISSPTSTNANGIIPHLSNRQQKSQPVTPRDGETLQMRELLKRSV